MALFALQRQHVLESWVVAIVLLSLLLLLLLLLRLLSLLLLLFPKSVSPTVKHRFRP